MSYQDYKHKPYFAQKQPLPEHLKEVLIIYAEQKRRTGSFLEAVLSNNLFEAINRADFLSKYHLPVITDFIYNQLPCESWGSKEAVEKWLAQDKAEAMK